MTAEGGVLVIGFGNPGRLDDGLGPAMAEAVEQMGLPNVTVDSDYQLTVEMAEEVARRRLVIFADADVSGPEPFGVTRVIAGGELSFSSHSVAPDGVMALAENLFAARTSGFVLGIRGYEFNEFGQWLCDRARTNLGAAVEFMRSLLTERSVEEIETELNSLAAQTGAADGDASCKTENT